MKDTVLLITGASSGIGRAMAFAFGREGAKIVICARKADALEQVRQELQQAHIEVLALTADVSVEADVKRLIEQTIAHFGQLNILINNAGISMRSMLIDTDPAVIQKVMDVNFMGTVYATRYALPHIMKTKGSIVGISSIAGFRGLPVRSGYSASKFAMNGFLEALRTELLHSGVHVLTACPGFTASNIRFAALGADGQVVGETMRDEGSMMTAEECADHILRAVKNRRRDLILTTQGKFTIWLNKWAPALMDKLVYNTLAKEKNSPLKRSDK
ncbi:SDR family oxidoreductase [Spirosoma utsteinense]|uniref:Short-subunit dehydrogenase n=1 Tax=Spirosoma utsteinense TaxID=2585773 RepID=A0ABR6WDN2_9BACT|nr:SDR family oxidoreductase [Spirosoma utsteinense]MBC3788262.1 short-subunit dehydrogenase [Spirosoma utsteinense]MBC3794675.1 short-subunit dehydrogenase [Spirosoma utsteinense]